MDSCVLTSLVFSLMISATSGQEEPSGSVACSSKFEYIFKVLQKLVDLENNERTLEEKIQTLVDLENYQRTYEEKIQKIVDLENKQIKLEEKIKKLVDLENKQRMYEEKIQKLFDLENKQRTLEEKIEKQNEEFNGQITSQNSLIEERSKVSTDKITGTTYVRWGRTTCPGNGTDFVYRGIMAGNKWNQNGGGANHLCMPDDPTWGSYLDGNSNGAQIHGTEIHADGTVTGKLFGRPAHDNDVPCAVCVSTRTFHMMVPARTNCYPGWTVEYRGYLVSSHPSWKGSSDFACLDSGLEFLYDGATNDNDHLIQPVEVSCGSLPCPPYVEGREAACVVCTK